MIRWGILAVAVLLSIVLSKMLGGLFLFLPILVLPFLGSRRPPQGARCPLCGREGNPGATYCDQDGARLQQANEPNH